MTANSPDDSSFTRGNGLADVKDHFVKVAQDIDSDVSREAVKNGGVDKRSKPCYPCTAYFFGVEDAKNDR
jgi:hypothetical protein